jgi:hypothetical protein
MAPHGDSLCDDVLLCLIAQTGRQAGQPNHRQRVRSPLTASLVKERFWLRKQSPRTCCVNCGCIIVLKCTRPAHTWGEAGAIQSLRKAFFCSVQPSCVHDRERPQDSSMNIPTHFASILAHYSRVRQTHTNRLRHPYSQHGILWQARGEPQYLETFRAGADPGSTLRR